MRLKQEKGMEPVGEEELVFLSQKSFVSHRKGNDSASFEEKTEEGLAWQVYEPGLLQDLG